MPDRDATLDAFITTDDETDETEDEPEAAQEAEEREQEAEEREQEAETTDVEPEETDVEPEATDQEAAAAEPDRVTERAETTFAWSPDALACEACGGQTHRRWRTDAGFVCPDCVHWERAPEQ